MFKDRAHRVRSRARGKEPSFPAASLAERRGPTSLTSELTGPPLSAFITSWQLAFEAARQSRKTVRSYIDSVKAMHAFLIAHSTPAEVEGWTLSISARSCLRRNAEPRRLGGDLRNLLACPRGRALSAERDGARRQSEGEQKAKPSSPDDELMSLLKACSRPTFQDRRDTALVRILIDTGIRVSGRVMLKRRGQRAGIQNVNPLPPILRGQVGGGRQLS